MAIKISNEPVINDDRFIVSPVAQRISGSKTLTRGYNYTTVSPCIIIEIDTVLTIDIFDLVTEGGYIPGTGGEYPYIDGASLTIGNGVDALGRTAQYVV